MLLVLFIAVNTSADEFSVVIGDWAPYEYFNDKNEPAGVNVSIITAVAKLLGHTLTISTYPWSRCLKKVEHGEADAIMSLYKTSKREKFLYFVPEHLSGDFNVLFVLKSSHLTFDGDLKILTGKTVLISRNNSYGDAFDNAKNFTRYEVGGFEQMFGMLRNKRAPYAIYSRYPLIYGLTKYKMINGIKILPTPVSQENLYIGFTKIKGPQYKDIALQFSEALIKYKKSKEYKKVISKYE